VLSAHGVEEFTVAAVAEHAGMSVGTIYRRFTSKEQLIKAVKDQLLEQLEADVAEALRSATPTLEGSIGAFAREMARTFARHSRTFPELLSGQPAEGVERGLQALETVQQALIESAEPQLAEINKPDPQAALRFTARSIIGSCVHRAATVRSWPDGLTWTAWAEEATDLALAHLTASGR
jgi:AcrR family transcriptional regulator